MKVNAPNYLKGSLEISIHGSSSERFMNVCRHRGIVLKNISCKDGIYYMDISLKDFKEIRPIVRKTRVKVKIVKKTGAPFIIFKLKKRYFFLIGMLFFLCLNLLLSSFVWHIEINGNQTDTKEEIVEFLKNNDVYTGMKRKNVNCSFIEKEIRKSFSDIIWVSASTKGTCLFIKIKENEDSYIQNKEEYNGPTDIIADCDAQIISMIVRNGVSLINPGDDVKKGDVLISGNIPIMNDEKEIVSYKPKDSDADIIGTTTIKYQDNYSNYEFIKQYEDVIREYYTFVFGQYHFTIGSRKCNYKEYERKCFIKRMKVNRELLLPVSIRIVKIKPYQSKKREYTDQEISGILSDRYERYIKELEKKGVEIIKNNVKINKGPDITSANGEIMIKKRIGIKKKAVLKQEKQKNGDDRSNH